MNNYFYISPEKEAVDIRILLSKIRESNWILPSTVIINCSPDYSSHLSQTINHNLSSLNRNELFEVIDLPMPYPNMTQVWNSIDRMYMPFTQYLLEWTRLNIEPFTNYLFIDSGVLRGKNFANTRAAIKNKLQPENYRFASLYVQDDSIFTPDFYVEKFNKPVQGGLLFHWENVDNPNWNY